MHRFLLSLLLLLPLTVQAANPPLEQVPDIPPPPMPAGIDVEDDLEPEVKIIKRDKAVIYEYRINNQLYMVKIVPQVGYPYYLMDTDGDGTLESRYNKLEPNIMVPQWMIYRW